MIPNWEDRAKALWQLLDDIDTADDACREHDHAFREQTRKLIKLRHAILTSDGYELSETASFRKSLTTSMNAHQIRRIDAHHVLLGALGPTSPGKGPWTWVGDDARERAQNVLDHMVIAGEIERDQWEVCSATEQTF